MAWDNNNNALIRVQITGVIHIGKDDLGIWKYPIRIILAYPSQIGGDPEGGDAPSGCNTQ